MGIFYPGFIVRRWSSSAKALTLFGCGFDSFIEAMPGMGIFAMAIRIRRGPGGASPAVRAGNPSRHRRDLRFVFLCARVSAARISSARKKETGLISRSLFYYVFARMDWRRYFFNAFHPTSIFSFSSHNLYRSDWRLLPSVNGGTWKTGFSL